MGALKDILEKSLRDVHYTKGLSQAEQMYLTYRESYGSVKGELAIWKTNNNNNIKASQLVQIEETFQHHVVLKKQTYTQGGTLSFIRYSVGYSLLIAGLDSLDILE